ncbi:probable aminopeptidase NPEPL1 [Paramacrobiotus metropolitanus]|uniref:probable aminopeptidase NPEPL1 n=1 Tax=Paramacrobiotus metropolitanus TaxID=2943436 RepID=UPI0024457D06|nr:probable aminopeptidase NPEPL1 [Paramacrobiotus metropolitanus]
MVVRTIIYSVESKPINPTETPCMIVGHLNLLRISLPYDSIKHKLGNVVSAETYAEAVKRLQPSSVADYIPLALNCAALAALPTKCSRHNAPSQPHALYNILKIWEPPTSVVNGVQDKHIVVACFPQDVFSLGCAISRAFPLYSAKTGSVFATKNVPDAEGSLPATPTKDLKNEEKENRVIVEFIVIPNPDAPMEFAPEPVTSRTSMELLGQIGQSIRLAAKIVDMPCNEMHTTAFVKEAQQVAKSIGAEIKVIAGEELRERGMHALYGVGQAASNPPYLVILSHKPKGNDNVGLKKIAWVGKGIVFDTGGLCIKTPKTVMCGMKRDCGGAAAVLGAFQSAVQAGFENELYAILCLAENAISRDASRPDDVVYSYSGKSIEINNTDAEGRLVLADGVTYAQRDLKCDIIVDIATLTGAQGIATGKHHAGIVTNNANWEDHASRIGKVSGDLVFPMVYAPEMHFSEFKSAVADMKNSVACRENATASCAGLFILSHLGFDWPGVWMHIDMAAPVHSGERATGYGVALLLALFGHWSRSPLLRSLPKMADIVEQLQRNAVTNDFSPPLTQEAGIRFSRQNPAEK